MASDPTLTHGRIAHENWRQKWHVAVGAFGLDSRSGFILGKYFSQSILAFASAVDAADLFMEAL